MDVSGWVEKLPVADLPQDLIVLDGGEILLFLAA